MMICFRRWHSVIVLAAVLGAGCDSSATVPSPSAKPVQQATKSPKGKVPADGILFVEGYHRATAMAHEQGKPLLLFFTADWCRFCHQMADESFRQGPVVSLSERFVCVLVDADHEQQLCQQFAVRMFPTILFVSGDGAVLGRVTGKQPSHKLIIEMQSALQTIARRTEWSPTTVTR